MMGRNFKNYDNATVVLILNILKYNVYIDLGYQDIRCGSRII